MITNRKQKVLRLSKKSIVYGATVVGSVLLLGFVSYKYIFALTSVLEQGTRNDHTPTNPLDNISRDVSWPIISSRVRDEIYQPSKVETAVMDLAETLGLKKPYSSVCNMWKIHSDNADIQEILSNYLHQLQQYEELIQKFQRSVKSSDKSILQETLNAFEEGKGKLSWQQAQRKVCSTLRIHPQGFQGIFTDFDTKLSKLTSSGYVEPLLPPMRHPLFCSKGWSMGGSLGYLIHDFEQMCFNLKPKSKIIFIDMGAAMDHHPGSNGPVFELLSLFMKFGFFFDHVYAYEVKKKDPMTQVYNRLPKDIVPVYHWINAPVSSNKTSALNPLQMALDTYQEDDLIFLKLDIDTPHLEMEFIHQLLQTDHNEGKHITDGKDYGKLVDHFYFEHHVCVADYQPAWKRCNGTAYDSLALFQTIRKRGIASHFWT